MNITSSGTTGGVVGIAGNSTIISISNITLSGLINSTCNNTQILIGFRNGSVDISNVSNIYSSSLACFVNGSACPNMNILNGWQSVVVGVFPFVANYSSYNLTF